MKELTKAEIEQRVAVLKRFKTLLQEQRKKFNDYLMVLETQEKSISAENIDAVLHHTELEQSIIGDIFTIQKVIEPIEKMYKFTLPEKDDSEIIKLKNDLDNLQDRVIEQNKRNRILLQARMTELRKEMEGMRQIHTTIPVSSFVEQDMPVLVDISV